MLEAWPFRTRPLRFSGDLEATFEGKTKLPQVGPRTKAPARYQAPVVGGLFGRTGGSRGTWVVSRGFNGGEIQQPHLNLVCGSNTFFHPDPWGNDPI